MRLASWGEGEWMLVTIQNLIKSKNFMASSLKILREFLRWVTAKSQWDQKMFFFQKCKYPQIQKQSSRNLLCTPLGRGRIFKNWLSYEESHLIWDICLLWENLLLCLIARFFPYSCLGRHYAVKWRYCSIFYLRGVWYIIGELQLN